ncbi:Mediator of RNA polymerase II transcription subunit 16 [Vermiconidia calcicola]|uniref:Mediator of RNA polymerase II transcription subunit 16 n=1 Tax=Vermiconidia calcicola TaxID=1690605 RepID=A0ACC3NZG5_9PEZI|nr:Mediator of RNA polymerase II transcription subunit 16 [Vermiconidia calcicola]
MNDNSATLPDAAMLDANIDDLFGEAADGLAAEALGVALPSAPLPPSLIFRIMEMQNKGCCTKVAWSNTGSIAYITSEGQKIAFRALIRDQKTGEWDFTEESKTPIPAPEGATWEHLQFSGIGIDLAAIDDRGVVHMHTLVGALGKMPAAPMSVEAAEQGGRSDLDAVVGMHWLPVYPGEFRTPYIAPANKYGDTWNTPILQRDAKEPSVHHAADNRHALLHVTREAKLTLMYQNEMVWHATSTHLESITSSNEILSHAAIGEEGDHLLLVTHDLSRRFRLYKITINWNAAQHTRPGGPPFTVVAPALEIGHLTVLEHVAAQQAYAARLSVLRLIPAVPSVAADHSSPTYPTVFAIFTRAPLPSDPTQQHQEAFSVTVRWHVESTVPTLHGSFAKLKTNGAVPAQNPVTVLRRQEDIITNKIVLSAEPQYFATILALTASDGTIDFRDRVTMATIEPYGDTTTVSSLPQAGFEQPMTFHRTHIAPSADGSAIALLNPSGTLTHKLMTLRYTWQPLEDGLSDTAGLLEAAVVCLARQHSILLTHSTANDEVLALLPHDLSSEHRALFLREILKMTNRTLDISMQDTNRQQMFAIKEPLLRLAFSTQFVTGMKPGTMERDWTGKFAFAFLNMRLVCTVIAPLVQHPQIYMRVDFLHSMRGLVKWGCDALVYITASLVHAAKQHKSSSPTTTPTQAFITSLASRDNPVLHLLLCTFTRAYIRFLASCLPKYLQSVQRVLPASRSVLERQQLEQVFQYGSSLPFKFHVFDSMITDFDTALRNTYTSNAVPSERRTEIELLTITDPTIADELHPVIQNLLEGSLPKFMEDVDLTALYFRDTSWIGIESSRGAEGYDVIRKLPLTKEVQVRVCRRCGAVMEDVTPERAREMPSWLGHTQRHCVCGNYWVLG